MKCNNTGSLDNVVSNNIIDEDNKQDDLKINAKHPGSQSYVLVKQ